MGATFKASALPGDSLIKALTNSQRCGCRIPLPRLSWRRGMGVKSLKLSTKLTGWGSGSRPGEVRTTIKLTLPEPLNIPEERIQKFIEQMSQKLDKMVFEEMVRTRILCPGNFQHPAGTNRARTYQEKDSALRVERYITDDN